MKHLLIFVAISMYWCTSASAQTPSAAPRGMFLGLDPSVAWTAVGETIVDDNGTDVRHEGWNLGTTVRFLRWFGVTSEFGRNSDKATTLSGWLVGVRMNTPFFEGNSFPARFFVNAMAGRSFAQTGPLRQQTREIVVGAGIDAALLRLQFDYVGFGAPVLKRGTAKNGLRVLLGAVVPLCLRACRPDSIDGLDLSRQ